MARPRDIKGGSVYRALGRCAELRSQAMLGGDSVIVATRASSRSVRVWQRSIAPGRASYVCHAGGLGGLGNHVGFMQSVVWERASVVVLPNNDRAGRVAAFAFGEMMRLCGVGVVIGSERDGTHAGWRTKEGWWVAEDLAVRGKVVVSSVERPRGALCRVAEKRWLVESSACDLEVVPGRSVPPVSACILAALSTDLAVRVCAWDAWSEWRRLPLKPSALALRRRAVQREATVGPARVQRLLHNTLSE